MDCSFWSLFMIVALYWKMSYYWQRYTWCSCPCLLVSLSSYSTHHITHAHVKYDKAIKASTPPTCKPSQRAHYFFWEALHLEINVIIFAIWKMHYDLRKCVGLLRWQYIFDNDGEDEDQHRRKNIIQKDFIFYIHAYILIGKYLFTYIEKNMHEYKNWW